MKLIMTLLVRDEEDILKENIDFHLSQGVDFIIATDNCSVDDTRDILLEYQKKGVLHYIYEAEDNYNQHKWVTKMAYMAYNDYDATWVINNDADEFWYSDKYHNLKEAFLSLDKSYNIVQAERNNFVALENRNYDLPFYSQMIFKEVHSLNPIGKPLPPKQAHVGTPSIIVTQGNHSVENLENKKIKHNLIKILHFPIRSHKQLINKITKGGAAYERNTELSPNIGNTWRNLYNQLKEDGNLDEYLANNMYTKKRLERELNDNLLIEDTFLKNYFMKLYQNDH
ncbi:MAG: glycosyltransferase family 2 protein [Campylobacterota bacterium]|nr:glycosyltransferase family 2 protein [Campylobacterota bacterium]